MTFSNIFALAIAMFVLAATPGLGILLVTFQTALNELRAGFYTTFGIISANIVFILIIGYGLSAFQTNLVEQHTSSASLEELISFILAGKP